MNNPHADVVGAEALANLFEFVRNAVFFDQGLVFLVMLIRAANIKPE